MEPDSYTPQIDHGQAFTPVAFAIVCLLVLNVLVISVSIQHLLGSTRNTDLQVLAYVSAAVTTDIVVIWGVLYYYSAIRLTFTNDGIIRRMPISQRPLLTKWQDIELIRNEVAGGVKLVAKSKSISVIPKFYKDSRRVLEIIKTNLPKDKLPSNVP